MVPTSTIAFVAFFLLVIPGTSYELLRGRHRLPREESPFLHISRILLSGTLITVLTFALLGIVHLIAPAALLDIPELLLTGTRYVAAHTWLVGKTLLLQIVLSVLLVVIFSDVRSSGSNIIHQADAWHALGELLPRPGETMGVSVRLKNGGEVMGHYYGASTELDPTKRELILRAPLSFRSHDESPVLAMDRAWQLMAISGSEISYVAAAYITDDAEPPSVRWWRTAGIWIRRNYLTWWVASIGIIGTLTIAVFVQ